MPFYTGITECRGAYHVSQHEAPDAVQALQLHIRALPHDDGSDMPEAELDWLIQIADGQVPAELVPAGRSIWMWGDGALREPPYSTYLVRTDISA